MNAQTSIFASLTETNAVAASISAEIEAKKAAKTAKKAPAKKATKPAAKPEAKKAAPAKKAEAKPAQKPAQAEFDAQAALSAFTAALIERETEVHSKDNEDNITYLQNPKNTNELLAAMTAANKAGFDLPAISEWVKITDKKHPKYIAVKVVTKIRMLFVALALSNFERCDGFTKPILLNVATVGALDTHDMCRTVSKRVTSDDVLRISKQVENKKDSAVSTASTQASSTRNALGLIGVLDIQKGKKNDAATWAETKQAKAVQKMVTAYTDKLNQAREAVEQARKAAIFA